MPHPQTKTRTRARTRRFTACHRHPSEPVTGFCALCLRDRLAGLDSSSSSGCQPEAEKVFVCSRRTKGHGVAPVKAPGPVPELRRSKSVAAEKREILAMDPRRNSCDVRCRSTLSDLFVVESMNLGATIMQEPVMETQEENELEDNDDIDEIKVSDDVIERNEVEDDDDEIGDMKTMKEFINIELTSKRRNFWESASVFSQKLRKWRQKQKEKKQCKRFNAGIDFERSRLGRDSQSEVADYGLGRRSCDTEPRFSIDAHRLSVEDPRFSFDEHRASWDGYMIARTIPRLAPMLSIVDNMMVPPVNKATNTMHSINEDGASSGGSAQSNTNSDTSTSNRGSSSSSMKSSSTNTVRSGGDDVKSASNARVSPANDVIFQGTKLVITEKELKDWHLNSIKNNTKDSVSNAPVLTSQTPMNQSNGHKKGTSSRWKKVCNLWGHKHKFVDKNDDKKNVEDKVIPESINERRNSSAKLVRNPSCVNRTRRDEFALDKISNRSSRYSTSDIDSGLLRLYLTPFRNSRRSKSGKSRVPSLPLMGANGLQLN
ncbi:UPF0503 protein, chloroplastic-like protein [Tanacetum coccineum]